MELSTKTVLCPVLKTTSTSVLHVAANILPPLFSASAISRWPLQILAIWQHLRQFLAIFSLRMRRPRKCHVMRTPRWKFPPSLKLIWPSVSLLQRYCCWYITWHCDLDLLTLFSGHTWRVTWSIPPPSLKILRLSVPELWVLTSPIGYHWHCVCSHCAWAVSCDLCIGANFPTYLKSVTPICLFIIELLCRYD